VLFKVIQYLVDERFYQDLVNYSFINI